MQNWIGDVIDLGPGRFIRSKLLMSTAIFRVQTPEGFVIAADGQTRNAIDLCVTSNNTQKVFPIGGGRKKFLAYSITGTSRIADRNDSRTAIDFITRINSSVQGLSPRREGSLADYARRVLAPIHQKLMDLKTDGAIDYPEPERIDPDEPGSTIIKVFIDGYYNGTASRVNARLFHNRQELAPVEVKELTGGNLWHQGSDKVFELMFETGGKNGAFPSYEKAAALAVLCKNETLRTYARMAHAYINACTGLEAQELDPDGTAGIGGHVHVAIITPAAGFDWAVPPLG